MCGDFHASKNGEPPTQAENLGNLRLFSTSGRILGVNHYVKDGAETLFIANQDFVRRRDLSLCAKWPVEKAELWLSGASLPHA